MSTHKPKPVTVDLPPEALQQAYEFGRKRNSKGFAGSVDTDPQQAHILGMKGELAFANLYNLTPDLSINDSSGDAGYDFQATVRGELRRIDVKSTTHYADPWLKLRADRCETPTEIYVLAAVDQCRVKFVGWLPDSHLKHKETTTRTGRENYLCKPDELLPMFEQGEIQ